MNTQTENIQIEKQQKKINAKENLTTLISPLGMIKFENGILVLYDFLEEKIDLIQTGIAKVENLGFFLRFSDKNNTYNFGIPVEKLFEFVDENKKLNEIKIGFYKFNGYGEYFKPVGGFTLPIENIYELRGLVKALGQSNSNSY